jgi:hypothetical protein
LYSFPGIAEIVCDIRVGEAKADATYHFLRTFEGGLETQRPRDLPICLQECTGVQPHINKSWYANGSYSNESDLFSECVLIAETINLSRLSLSTNMLHQTCHQLNATVNNTHETLKAVYFILMLIEMGSGV